LLCSPLPRAPTWRLLPQAERGRRDASQELSAACQQAAQLGQENADLQQRLAATQRQLRQLESLQSFADSWEEQQQREQELMAALARANGRVGQLELDLGQAAAALQATQHLASAAAAEDTRQRQQEHRRGRQDQRQQQQQGQRAGSPSLSDLCDLEGALSQFEAAGNGSPQRSSGQAGSSGGLPSTQRALQQQRQYQAEQRRRQEQEHGDAEADAVGQEVPMSMAASLQQQLLEQQEQLALLQLQQQMHASSNQSAEQQQHQQQLVETRQSSQVAALELEVGKLKRRNTQLQTALAEASLQHARAAAAGQRQLAELLQEAAQLEHQRDQAQQQLAQLQAAVSALGVGEPNGGGCVGVFGGCSSEQLEELHGELLDYAGRCNAAVEQNAGV
jgi:hypothetical protein